MVIHGRPFLTVTNVTPVELTSIIRSSHLPKVPSSVRGLAIAIGSTPKCDVSEKRMSVAQSDDSTYGLSAHLNAFASGYRIACPFSKTRRVWSSGWLALIIELKGHHD